jgi:hypothetical protein
MARRRFKSTPESIARRIAEGRGQGVGCNYLPWHEVQDFPSRGVIHRPFGLKSKRVHHLFSDLEFRVFLIYDLLPCILDIREQYPLLPLEETLEIARKLKVKHPVDPAIGYPVVMTTDFLLKLKLRRQLLFHARTIKYSEDMDDLRVQEKFMIERIYFCRREIDWGYVTEQDVPVELAENAALVHPFYFLSDLYPLTEKEVRRVSFYLTGRVRQEELPLISVLGDCDQIFGLPPGKSFSVACHLIARKVWHVDLRRPIKPDERLVLV